jgi:hypothetical protein
MTSHDIGARVRAANPVPLGALASPPLEVLARIVATPRGTSARGSRRVLRRPALVAIVALLCAAGLAIGATVSVRYFGDAGTPLPAPVRQALLLAASRYAPTAPLALDESVTAYTFTSSDGRGRVYMAPYAARPGFCAALAVAGRAVQAGCTRTALGGEGVTNAPELAPWGLALTPDMHALLGRLAPSAAGDRVQLTFEDGTRETLPRHGPWFAYAVAGERTRAGHRPTSLELRDGTRVVRRVALEPVSFNTLAEARALVPAGDGSRAQQAVRRVLLADIESPDVGDGGLVASHTLLAQTSRVGAIAFPGRLDLQVYATPVRRIAGWRTDGTIVIARTNRSQRPVFAGVGVNEPRAASFRSVAGCGCSVPGHDQWGYHLLQGDVPLGVTRVSVRLSDGRELAAHLIAHGAAWIWVERSRTGVRPVGLVGRGPSGALVASRALHGLDGNSFH